MAPSYYGAQIQKCTDGADSKSECESESAIHKIADSVYIDYFYKSYFFDAEE